MPCASCPAQPESVRPEDDSAARRRRRQEKKNLQAMPLYPTRNLLPAQRPDGSVGHARCVSPEAVISTLRVPLLPSKSLGLFGLALGDDRYGIVDGWQASLTLTSALPLPASAPHPILSLDPVTSSPRASSYFRSASFLPSPQVLSSSARFRMFSRLSPSSPSPQQMASSSCSGPGITLRLLTPSHPSPLLLSP